MTLIGTSNRVYFSSSQASVGLHLAQSLPLLCRGRLCLWGVHSYEDRAVSRHLTPEQYIEDQGRSAYCMLSRPFSDWGGVYALRVADSPRDL